MVNKTLIFCLLIVQAQSIGVCQSTKNNRLSTKIQNSYSLDTSGHLNSISHPVIAPSEKQLELNMNCKLLLIPQVREYLALSMEQIVSIDTMIESLSVDAASTEQDEKIKTILVRRQLDELVSINHWNALVSGSVERIQDCETLSWLLHPSEDVLPRLDELKGKTISRLEQRSRDEKLELVREMLEILTEDQRLSLAAQFEKLSLFIDLNVWFSELDFSIWIWQMEKIGSTEFSSSDDGGVTSFLFDFDHAGNLLTKELKITLIDLVKYLRRDAELAKAIALSKEQEQEITNFFSEQRAKSEEWGRQWPHLNSSNTELTKSEREHFNREREKQSTQRNKEREAFIVSVLYPHQIKFLQDYQSLLSVMSFGLPHELIHGNLRQQLGISVEQSEKLEILINASIDEFKAKSIKLETQILEELNRCQSAEQDIGIFVPEFLKCGRGEVIARTIKQLAK